MIDQLSPYEFNPGDWHQDIFTIPVEAALIWSENRFYTPRSYSWASRIGDNDKSRKNTTFTASSLAPVAVVTTGLVLGGLSLSNPQFDVAVESLGWLHSTLLTEIASSGAKVIVQRERPFYDQLDDNEQQNLKDAKMSFFSSHASHLFAFSTYSSLMLFHFAENPVWSVSYAIAAYSAASYVSYTRVSDHAHHWGDVVVGAAVGTWIAESVFFRVQEVEQSLRYSKVSNFQWHVSPDIVVDNSKKRWYGANLEVDF